jgi:hypothetical protein
MRRLAHVAVRRDPTTGNWWWVCIDPDCRLEDGIALGLDDHHAAITSATDHVARSGLRPSPVKAAASTPAAASGRGAVGGER